jgi:hypothetical protein
MAAIEPLFFIEQTIKYCDQLTLKFCEQSYTDVPVTQIATEGKNFNWNRPLCVSFPQPFVTFNPDSISMTL